MAGAAHRRGPWSPQEDSLLQDLVGQHGASNWVKISNLISTRSPKQCRERYHQNLKPNLNLDPITEEEGRKIEKMVEEMGRRWAEIARRLGNRSDNAVKNWWNGGMNRRRRRDNRRAENGAVNRPHPQAGLAVAAQVGQYPQPHPALANHAASYRMWPQGYPVHAGRPTVPYASYQMSTLPGRAPNMAAVPASMLAPYGAYMAAGRPAASPLPSPSDQSWGSRGESTDGAAPSLTSDNSSFHSPSSAMSSNYGASSYDPSGRAYGSSYAFPPTGSSYPAQQPGGDRPLSSYDYVGDMSRKHNHMPEYNPHTTAEQWRFQQEAARFQNFSSADQHALASSYGHQPHGREPTRQLPSQGHQSPAGGLASPGSESATHDSNGMVAKMNISSILG